MKSFDKEGIRFELDPELDNYAVIGNPVAHSKSPQIHLAFARQTNQQLTYQTLLAPSGKFNIAVNLFMGQGGRGLNVTVPYKHQALEIVTRVSARAGLAKAVNILTFKNSNIIDGDNTDGVGLLADLENNGIQITGKRLLIIGAGGAVAGVLGPILELSPDSITIANRTLARAETLVAAYQTASNIMACGLSALAELGSFDVVINGTSSGLSGELPVIPESIIDANSRCYDMVYGSNETVFVSWCKSLGAKVALDGLGMLVEQAAESFYIWRGVRPATEPVLKMLRREMTR